MICGRLGVQNGEELIMRLNYLILDITILRYLKPCVRIVFLLVNMICAVIVALFDQYSCVKVASLIVAILTNLCFAALIVFEKICGHHIICRNYTPSRMDIDVVLTILLFVDLLLGSSLWLELTTG